MSNEHCECGGNCGSENCHCKHDTLPGGEKEIYPFNRTIRFDNESWLNDLSKEELTSVLVAYDKYIQSANDENNYNEGWRPVCLHEFYDNDYEHWRTDNHQSK